jgi:penicillin-binding protein 1A
LSLAGLIALGILIIFCFFVYYSYETDLPSVDSLQNYQPEQQVMIYDRKGKLIGSLGKIKRTIIPWEKIPKNIIQAVIAAEDSTFFKHQGLNYFGMIRAFWVNMWAGRYKQGGSTITQQVVKRLLLTPERTLKRKFQEVILARRLEATLSKSKILHLYLNEIYFGHGRYGVEEASRFFFDKHAWEINLAQAALLAGLPKGPMLNSPLNHPKRAKQRQNYVLTQMVNNGFVSTATADKLKKQKLKEIIQKSATRDLTPGISTFVSQYIKDKNLDPRSSSVTTTIDLDLQNMAVKAVEKGLQAYDKRQSVISLKHHFSNKKKKQYLKKLAGKVKLQSGKIYKGLVDGRHKGKIVVDLGKSKGIVVEGMERYYPEGYEWNVKYKNQKKSKKYIRPGDEFRVSILAGKSGFKDYPLRLRVKLGPQAALVLIKVDSGDVLAMVGGMHMKMGDFNRALSALRQPGSSFKPFIYATALESKEFTPATMLNDGPEVYQKWIPRNHGKFYGRVTFRTALTKSINSISVHLLKKTGVEKVIQLVRNAGVKTPLHKDLSLALGSSEVTLYQLTSAFTIFPTLGIYRSPRLIKKLGNEIMPADSGKRVLTRQTAWLMTSLLRSVVKKGTAWRAKKLKGFVAGKTGTTNLAKDTWFMGFTSDYVCGVYVGFDDHKSLGKHEYGGKTALPIFMEMIKSLPGYPFKTVKPVSGIVTRLIDPKTGKGVHPGTSGAIKEYFQEGTEPPLPEIEPEIEPDDGSKSPANNNPEDILLQ